MRYCLCLLSVLLLGAAYQSSPPDRPNYQLNIKLAGQLDYIDGILDATVSYEITDRTIILVNKEPISYKDVTEDCSLQKIRVSNRTKTVILMEFSK